MEKGELKLYDFIDLVNLIHIYIECEGLSYKEAFKKAKKKLSPEKNLN